MLNFSAKIALIGLLYLAAYQSSFSSQPIPQELTVAQKQSERRNGVQNDWPMFRGPNQNGTAEGYPLPSHWNADETNGDLENVLWKTKVPGLGHSSPIVVGDRIFLATAIASAGAAPLIVDAGGRPDSADDNGEQAWVVLCYDKMTGTEIWRQTARQGTPRASRHSKATHANTSVMVDGDNVVAFFGSEGLYCYNQTGTLQWSKDLGVIDVTKYDIGWGYASSPAVFNGRIVLLCDHPKDPFLAAFRLTDGSELWRVSRKDICERSWGTPLIHRTPERTQVVVNGWPWIVSYDLESGDELWRIKGGGDNAVPTPFVANDKIYITNSHGGPAPIFAVRPDAAGDISLRDGETKNESVVWSQAKGGCYLSTPVVYQNHIYLGNTNGVVRCYQADSGEFVYQKRLASNAGIIASLVAGDNKIILASENGNVYVLASGPEFSVISENKMGQPCFATPAVSQGIIYVRTTDTLIAIGESKAGT